MLILHFQIRLHEGRQAGLCMALDTLRPALQPPSDVPLDHTGRRLPGWSDRPVCPQLHSGRCDRRLRPGMAADRGRVLCTLDRIPPDRWVKKTASWKCGKH